MIAIAVSKTNNATTDSFFLSFLSMSLLKSFDFKERSLLESAQYKEMSLVELSASPEFAVSLFYILE